MEELTTVKRGIIINGEARKGRLSVFHCTLMPQGEPVLKMAIDAEAAVRMVAQPGLQWIAGTAATKRLAKRLGLQLRQRAPGAGRSRVDQDKKAKRITFWLKPELHPELKTIVERFKKEKSLK